jgi:hypothetical protein
MKAISRFIARLFGKTSTSTDPLGDFIDDLRRSELLTRNLGRRRRLNYSDDGRDVRRDVSDRR